MLSLRTLIILTTLVASSLAVINIKQAKRREASIADSYGPPQKSSIGLPAPVYGAPAVAHYPPPPPDIPPLPQIPHQEYGPPQQIPHQEYGPPKQLPHQEYGPPPQIPHQQYGPPPQHPPREYGVPVLKYGPPKINVEYGAPLKKPFFGGGSIGGGSIGGGGGGGIFNSLFDQFKSHFGVAKTQYGPPHPAPRPLALKNTHLPSGPAPVYGPPKPLLPPSSNYGPPSPVYGPPKPIYGPPQLPISKPAPIYGPPQFSHPKPAPVYGPPSTSYGVPIGGPGISGNFELPNKHVQIFESNHLGSGGSGGHSVSCDGWKPIPAPVGHNSGGIGTSYNGLTDEQLIAVALHSDGGRGGNGGGGHGGGGHGGGGHGGVGHGGGGHQQLPLTGGIGDFHSGGGNIDVFQSNSIELSHSDEDAFKFGGGNGDGHNGGFGLIPPSGMYGVPPGESYHGSGHAASAGLAINYGSVSGNTKPWHSGGQPPRRPISFRAPVPQGFLESIGASVQHLDAYGVKPLHEPPTYIPPPTVPSNHHQHYQHQQHQQHHQQHQQQQHYESHGSESVNFGQSLPNFQEPRFNQAQDCGHGPNLQGGGGGFDISSNQVSHYDHSSGGLNHGGATVSADYIATGISDSYGPPPAGNPHDAIGYESKRNSVAVANSESQATGESSQSSLTQSEEGNNSNGDELPGLEGLNVVSAQKSHSIQIPTQSTSGSSYQVQFQSSNPGQQSGHDQVLSEGLLQSILSAIEQPNTQLEPATAESRVDHKDVNEFLNSPEGKKVLDDSSETHK